MKFFLDEPPINFDLTPLEAAGRKPFVARVCLPGGIVQLTGTAGGSYHRWRYPNDDHGAWVKEFFKWDEERRYVWHARLEIIDVLFGKMNRGDMVDVLYGRIERAKDRAILLSFFETVERKFYVASYLDEGGERTLVAFDVSPSEYHRWQEAQSAREMQPSSQTARERR